MLRSKCDFKTRVYNLVYTRLYKSGAPKPPFWADFNCNLMAILMAYIFGTKHDIDNRSIALTIARGLLHCLKMS